MKSEACCAQPGGAYQSTPGQAQCSLPCEGATLRVGVFQDGTGNSMERPDRYGIYVSAGKTVVSPLGLRLEDAPQATRFTSGRAKVQRYVFGREDTVYYKILSQGQNPVHVEDDPSPWHTLPGVALSQAQYMELALCSPRTLTKAGSGKPCRAFLSLDDPDLTPEQREYVRQHAITRRDIKPLIKDLERAARIQDRWM